ncbi:HTH-type transcriptional regulator BetI [bioreactor metagenome]|uniref:HTH-type transcriptional regulator BetI n=1 Tax=bioreactor metagenome TaxID=1076179 RepID=A0A644TUG5_9ZZZZ|nr:TetR family transcriptional regulator [Negativicutes bacterium]
MATNYKQTPKRKILDATLRIIGTEGVHHVTSRKVASLANVNVAAINYYFGSKDNAVNEALTTFTGKLMSSFKYLDDFDVPPKTRIRNFLRSYADYTLEYPDVFRNFIDQVLHESVASCEQIEFMKQTGLDKLKIAVQEITQPQNDAELTMKIFQMFSSLEFPVLVGAKMKSLAHFDYYDQDCRYCYIELVLKSLLYT